MILQSRRVWILNEWMEVQIEFSVASGKITEIHPYGTKPADLDFVDLRVVPGFLDVHTHGAYGFDTNDAEVEGLKNWLKNIVSIDLRDNRGLSDIAVGALKSALPGCSIALPELVYEIEFSGHRLRSDEKQLVFPAAEISDLSGIIKMTALEELDLRDNEITNLYPFEITASKESIRKLNLSGNQIRDVLSLYALSALEELDLSGNQIESVANLRKLTSLKKLTLTGNPLSEEAVYELRSLMPDCTIVF